MLNLGQQIIVDNRVNCREQLLESIILSWNSQIEKILRIAAIEEIVFKIRSFGKNL